MLEQFEHYRQSEKLFLRNDNILLAVSGGIDSVVMLDLFISMGYNISVAHCNFRLRGKESDGDEEFVEKLCRKTGIKLYLKKFNTDEYASEKGISIQMAARDLRYQWLTELKEKEGYDYISTGHNLNDSIETIIINLTRGTGINGLTGINPKSGFIIRPVLFATRQMIQEYAENNNLKYREDSSNLQTKYTRNKIRHGVIPILEQINPSVLHSINETAGYLKSANIIYEHAIEKEKQKIISHEKKTASLKITDLKNLIPAETWIYEIFHGWNFGKHQIGDILNLINADTGKQLFSESHVLTKDRDKIIITSLEKRADKEFIISSSDDFNNNPLIERIEIIPGKNITINDDPSYAYVDASLIQYPMRLRKWKQGDYFYPLGMKGRKKISDFLIDLKISLPEKENVYVLEMNSTIIWIVGFRIDDRYKVTHETDEVLVIRRKKV